MADNTDKHSETTINRRRALQGLSVAVTGGLAGCFGGEDGDEGGDNGGDGSGNGSGGGQGERVPTLDMTYWSNAAFTAIAENALPVVVDNLAELGINVEIRPTEFTTEIVEQIEDQRTRHLQYWWYTSDPGRLDPNPMLERFFAERAGNTGTLNTSNYVNCDYTAAGYRQQNTAVEEERRQHVADALEIIAEDAVINPVAPVINVAGVRTDQVDIGGTGVMGVQHHNPYFYIQSEPTNSDTMTVDTTPITVEASHYQVLDSTPSLSLWNKLVSSTLVQWTSELELQNVLAEDITIEENGELVTVELRDDAQFHNGDPVTAEDVQFTFEYLWERPEQFPQLEVPPYDTIEVIDELTTEFNFSTTYAPLVNRNWSTWGILHRESWMDMGALDQETIEPGADLIGSGPFELTEFTEGQGMTIEGTDTHPLFQPNHNIEIRAFRDLPPKVEAFRTNDIDVITDVPFSVYEEINDQMSDVAETVIAEGFLPHGVFHNYPVAPSKFRPYRQAVGHCFDRELINETAFYGEGYEPMQPVVFLRNHPYTPDDGDVYDFGDDTTGDLEQARTILEEAGWSWDDDGNLRYPEGADLEPLWPAEERPDPADYPCLNDEGEFQFPS